MRRLISIRALVPVLSFVCATLPSLSQAVDAAPSQTAASAGTSNIVIGFVGGFVSHDDAHHGPVRLAQRLKPMLPPGTYIQVFENRRRKLAYETVLRLLDANHDGILSPAEKARARIVLFGHSWGASAAVQLARDLRRAGVAVLLTVQVDSVAKAWQNDSVIPDNVAEAVNFYQPHGILHGRALITAADPTRTEILGNYRTDYRQHPITCPDTPWLRFFTPGHLESECDPHVWSQVEDLVRQRLASTGISTATASAIPTAVQSGK